jgi:PAS domain S-box-containing protein
MIMPEQQHNVEITNVLLIEDNDYDMEILEQHLAGITQRKIMVESCCLLSQGLARLQKNSIDLIFLDLSLPDSFGIDTVTKVHKHSPGVPIVVLTGTDDDDIARQSIKAGAQDYLVKGNFDSAVLARSVNYAIERQQGMAAQQWLSSLVECSNDAIISKSLDNKILSWNKGAERLYGYKSEEVIGKPMEILLFPDLPNDSIRDLEAIKRGEEVNYYEARRRRKDGSQVIVSLLVSAIKNADGVLTGLSVVARDITSEKLAEAEHKQGLELQHTLMQALEAATAAVVLTDAGGDKRISYVNTAFEKLTGYSQAEVIGRNCAFLQNDDRTQPEIEIMRKAIAARQTCHVTLRNYKKDGSMFWNEITISPVFDLDGQLRNFIGIASDVTDRRLAERTLKEAEQRLHLSLVSAEMGVWDWDVVNNTVWHSLKSYEIFGYQTPPAKWTYETFLDHVIAEDRVAAEKSIEQSFASGDYKLRCRIEHARDHSIRWIACRGETYKDEGGNVVRMMGTIVDITEDKLLEQLAYKVQQEREEITHSVVQHAPIGIVILDSRLRITDANSAFSTMTGFGSQPLVDRSLTEILPCKELDAAQEFLNEGKQLQISRLPVEIPNEVSVSRKYWDLSLWAVGRKEGKVDGAVLQIIDCTNNVILEQQREDFVAAIAHDIKNPLIGARRIFETLCQSGSDMPERHRRALLILKDSNENLLNLVQNLVDIYRYEAFSYPCRYEDVDIKMLVNACIEQVSHFAAGRQVTVSAKVPDALSPIQADAIGMRRVLMNLLHNAVKFNIEGGTVEVVVHQDNNTVRVSVTDTGDGISESDQLVLFQRFGQGRAGKRFTSGTGLGLFLSKQIVEAHHGTIICQSKTGSGTTFIVSIPASKPLATNKEIFHDH